MKRLLISLLVLSPVANATPMNCSDLGDFINRRFNTIQYSTNENCAAETLTDLTENRNEALITSVIRESGCDSLHTLENKINQLESEIALLAGFEKMKEEIVRKKEETGSQSLTRAQRAAKDFRKGLITARLLEGILFTSGETPLISALKALPIGQRNNPSALRTTINNLCRGRASASEESNLPNICDPGFNIDPDAVVELNTLIESATLDQSQIDSWKNALAIQVGDSPSHFRTMYNQVSGAMGKIADGRLGLSRAELNSISSLPSFQNQDSLPILNNLSNRIGDMSIAMKVDGTKVLAEELKNRQMSELGSKLSWVLKETRSAVNLTAEQQEICHQTTTDFQKAKSCWDIIKSMQQSIPDSAANARTLIGNISSSFDSSFAYHEKLKKVPGCLDNGLRENQSALTRANFGYTFNDAECVDFATEDLYLKIDQAKILNELKKKIQAKKERISRMTDFALKKFQDMRCVSPDNIVNSNVDCIDERVTIARQVTTLHSDLLGMSLSIQNPSSSIDITSLCEESLPDEEKICEFVAPPPAIANVTDRPALPIPDSSSVEVRDARDPSREAFTEGLSNIGWGIVGQLQNRSQMYNPSQSFNPYPTNYNPYLGSSRLSTSDQILFNARFYGGYGIYTPTLGAAPYTAFPLISPYVQAGYSSTGNSSAYFSNFGSYK